MRFLCIAFCSVVFFSCGNTGQRSTAISTIASKTNPADSLRIKVGDVIRGKRATVGVAVTGFEKGDTVSINGDTRFAMMSVGKFPQALLLLNLADEGKYDVAKPVCFDAQDLKTYTGSTIRKDHPESAFCLSFSDVLHYSIGQSDNITSNKIFGLEGGPKAVEAYVHATGIRDIGLGVDYGSMFADSFRLNWCTPRAMLQLLQKFHQGELLSDSNNVLLWQAMVNATSGPDRIRGLLPPGTRVAHKTGTSGTDGITGITPATNDVGIVQLPNGKYFGIAVFVAESREPPEENAAIIARISRAAWDYFIAH